MNENKDQLSYKCGRCEKEVQCEEIPHTIFQFCDHCTRILDTMAYTLGS